MKQTHTLIEDFVEAPSLGIGDLSHFAHGYSGWRYNVESIGGHWKVEDGNFRGTEEAAARHPATASYGFAYHDVVVTCEVRLDDIPKAGTEWRILALRFTDSGGYVCTARWDEKGLSIEKSDHDREGPSHCIELATLSQPTELGTWHDLKVRIVGDELSATLDGNSIRGSHSFIDRPKTSILFMVQTQASIRRLRIGSPN